MNAIKIDQCEAIPTPFWDGIKCHSVYYVTFLFYEFNWNVCFGGFAGSEPSLSIACAGPDPTIRSRNSSAMAEFYPNV